MDIFEGNYLVEITYRKRERKERAAIDILHYFLFFILVFNQVFYIINACNSVLISIISCKYEIISGIDCSWCYINFSKGSNGYVQRYTWRGWSNSVYFIYINNVNNLIIEL